ncbi:hypothetical protein Avbf_17429, partial [Armadillidium vulgare]
LATLNKLFPLNHIYKMDFKTDYVTSHDYVQRSKLRKKDWKTLFKLILRVLTSDTRKITDPDYELSSGLQNIDIAIAKDNIRR